MASKNKWPLKPLTTTCARSCTLSCTGDNLWSAKPLLKLSSAPASNHLLPRASRSHCQPRLANKAPPPLLGLIIMFVVQLCLQGAHVERMLTARRGGERRTLETVHLGHSSKSYSEEPEWTYIHIIFRR